MGTYTQILYQLVFSTKSRERTLSENKRDDLYKYISGILKNKKCQLFRINGTENHLHILTHLHPIVSLSNLIKDIKIASSLWIKGNNIFRNFSGWQVGYGAFTYSIKEKDRLIAYIKDQQKHHKIKSFNEELIQLLNEQGVEYDEEYLL
jgi:putative transposase